MRACIISALLVCSIATADTSPRLKEFAKFKHQQTEELATRLHIEVPPAVIEFFHTAERGDANAVSNSFLRIQPPIEGRHVSVLDGFNSVLWIPVSETRFAYEQSGMWDGDLLQKYADGILGSLPPNSVYFGGTDPGRFVITMFNDTEKSPGVVVLTPKFGITQNALMDMRYTEYLRLTQGDRLWLPTTNDIERAFQEYASELQQRQARGEHLSPDEQVDSSNHVHGVAAVMNINGIVTRWVFEHNKDKHPFYVEESYVIPWMYAYMEPHGLILKLNNEPLDKLDPAAIERDRELWAKLSRELLADPKFLANEFVRKTYSKMRSAIGGLYAYRRLTDEAEAAYKQAIVLSPASPEANFRLAQLYMEQSRRDDAVAVLEQLQKLDPRNDKIAAAIGQIRMLPPQAERKQPQ